jgi:hypothetical protein
MPSVPSEVMDPSAEILNTIRVVDVQRNQHRNGVGEYQREVPCAIEDSSCIHSQGGVLQDWRKGISDDV